MSTTYEPQTYGQIEITLQTLEDMICAYVIDFGGNRDDSFPLVEFTYNNNYHSCIQMGQYDALYQKPGRNPIFWTGTEENLLMGHNIV